MSRTTLLVFLVAGGFVAVAPPESHAQLTFRSVALTDDVATGSGQVDGRPDGTFLGSSASGLPFVVPVISSTGQIAFEGSVGYAVPVEGKPDSRAGIWVWDPVTGTLRLVMISGATTPVGGTFGTSFSEVRIGHDGAVLFDALISGGPAPTYLFHATPTSVLSPVVTQTAPAPGVPGGQFGDARQGRGFINNGFVFTNQPVSPSLGNGAWQWSGGALQPVIVPGMVVPDNANATFVSGTVTAVGGNGRAILFGPVREGTTTTAALWTGNAASLTRIATVGLDAPGRTEFEPLTYAGFTEATTNDAGQVAFTGSASSFLSPFIPALWAGTPGSTPDPLRLAHRRDEFATNPHFPSETFNSFSRPSINGSGQLAFQGNTNLNRDGFWVSQPGFEAEPFTLSSIVIEGQPVTAPQFPSGVTFDQLTSGFSFNALGQMVFLANLAGTGITTANDLSLWGYDPQEGLQLVAQEGQSFTLAPGDSRTVSGRQGTFSFFQGIQFMSGGGGQDGRATGLSDDGTFTFLLNFADDTSGVFSASLRPVGADFFWRGDDALDDNWHTISGPNTNWKDSAEQIEQPPGSLGTENVTIRDAPIGGVFLTAADVHIGSLDALGGLTVRRRLELSGASTIESLVLDHLESEVAADGAEVALVGTGNRWTQGTLSGTGDGGFVLFTGASLELDSAGDDLSARVLSADLTSRGTVVLTSGLFGLDATINGETGSTIRLRDGSIVGSGVLEVAGRLEKINTITSTPGRVEIFVPVNSNAGLLVVQAGHLLLGKGGTINGGRWEIHENTVLELDADFGVDTDIDADVFIGGPLGTDPAAPTGEVRLVSGDFFLNGAATATVALNGTNGLLLDGAIVDGSGTLVNKRTATWKSGRFDFDLGGTFKNEGSLLVSDESFDYEFVGRLDNDGEFVHRGKSLQIGGASILNKGTFTVSDGSILIDSASHTALFENQGRLEFIGEFDNTPKALDFRLQSTSPGELAVDGVDLNVTRPGTHQDAGFVTTRGSDQIRFSAPQFVSGASSFTGSGEVEIAAEILISSGELISSIGAVGFGPKLRLRTGGDIDGAGVLTNTGAVSWEGGTISGKVTHRGTAFDISDSAGTPELSGGTLTNEQTIRQGGDLLVSDGGRIQNQPGATYELSLGDILHVAGSERGTLVLDNATFRGDGRVEARLALNGGQVVGNNDRYLTFAGGGDSMGGGTFTSMGLGGRLRLENGTGQPSVDYDFSGEYSVASSHFELGPSASVTVIDGEFVIDADFDSTIEGNMRGGPGGRVTARSSITWNAGVLENFDFLANNDGVTSMAIETGATKEIGGEMNIDGTVRQKAGATVMLAGNLRVLPEPLSTWIIEGTGGFTGAGGIKNEGSFVVKSPDLITFGSSIVFDNRHIFVVDGGGRAAFQSGSLVQYEEFGGIGRLADGIWFVENGGLLTLGSARLASSNATIFLRGTGDITNFSGDFENEQQGSFSLSEGAQFVLDGEFTNNGSIFVEFGSALVAPSIVNNGGATINGELTGSTEFFSDWGGSGKVNGQVINGGSGSPGNSPGTFTVDGDYLQVASGDLLIELASVLSFDLLAITGSADLDGTLTISLDGGFVPAGTDTFMFLTAAGLTGEFSNAPDGSRLATFDALGSFLVTYEPDGVLLSAYIAVPEPSALTLLMLGAAAFFRRRRVRV